MTITSLISLTLTVGSQAQVHSDWSLKVHSHPIFLFFTNSDFVGGKIFISFLLISMCLFKPFAFVRYFIVFVSSIHWEIFILLLLLEKEDIFQCYWPEQYFCCSFFLVELLLEEIISIEFWEDILLLCCYYLNNWNKKIKYSHKVYVSVHVCVNDTYKYFDI